MQENQQMSKAFIFSLKALEMYRKFMAILTLWSLWGIFFSNLEFEFIGKILLSFVAFGLSFMPLLVDFNESHATNPLWTGHARFHLVWQVTALTSTGLIVILLLWVFPSYSNIIISTILLYMWLICFFIAWLAMPLYDGKPNDVNGVPPVNMNFFGKKYEIDRNLQGILSATILCGYACVIIYI